MTDEEFNVIRIESGAFMHCRSLKSVIIPVYVPAESIELYKATPQWQDFANIRSIPNNR